MEYSMKLIWDGILPICTPMLKSISKATPEGFLMLLLQLGSSMQSILRMVKCYLYSIHPQKTLVLKRLQTLVSGYCYARDQWCKAVYMWLYFTFANTFVKPICEETMARCYWPLLRSISILQCSSFFRKNSLLSIIGLIPKPKGRGR